EFPLLWVEGEISNLSQPSSGHIYFTLKDARAQVSCAMFKGRNQFLRFRPENGQQVLVRARVSLYEARGNFQLLVEHIEEAGDGALQREFERLKAQLAAQGLFDEAHKKPLPILPKRIGVITSTTGAAIRDVLSVLQRRFPTIPVLIYPVAVQGDAAAPQIVKQLQSASQRQDCDVLLLVRGGGSLEDLWPFNEEIVAHAIADCDIPIISGVGHEIDFTIADFVADVRAPTPSAAAELISPDQTLYLQRFDACQQRLQQLISNQITGLQQQLGWLEKRLQQKHPSSYLQQQSQRLDELEQRLHTGWFYGLRLQQHLYRHQLNRLKACSPELSISRGQQTLDGLQNRLLLAHKSALQNKRQLLAGLSRTLHAVSPLETLSRGYAIASNLSGKTITDSQQVKSGEQIQVRLAKGALITRVEKKLKGS
ncbi:MAG: exodeoxyribonuclease VII large subunit, partial [Gammaproteobacteria bacterium]|nr:exodeoxyribonuclease VII large subunit [Gammaproteobacteria bacterium]